MRVQVRAMQLIGAKDKFLKMLKRMSLYIHVIWILLENRNITILRAIRSFLMSFVHLQMPLS